MPISISIENFDRLVALNPRGELHSKKVKTDFSFFFSDTVKILRWKQK